jgi:hypothetical protein
VIMMKDGQIFLDGPPDRVLQRISAAA